MMACGLEAKITAYRNSLDIDVRLGNNELLKHKKYKEFLDGALHPGTITRHEPKVGDTVMANNGQMMTLTAYITSKDVDVTFEDGTLVTNKSLYSFLGGSIENPNAPYGKQKWRIGMIGIANNGLRMKITKRVNKETLHIQFESGHERDILVNNFRLGRANVLDENGKMLLSRSPNAKGEFLGYLTQYAYDEGNKIWYKVIDTYTGEHMLLTPQMMMANRRVSPAF